MARKAGWTDEDIIAALADTPIKLSPPPASSTPVSSNRPPPPPPPPPASAERREEERPVPPAPSLWQESEEEEDVAVDLVGHPSARPTLSNPPKAPASHRFRARTRDPVRSTKTSSTVKCRLCECDFFILFHLINLLLYLFSFDLMNEFICLFIFYYYFFFS